MPEKANNPETLRSSADGTLELLKKWKEDRTWVFVIARFDGRDEHRFWARIGNVSTGEVWLAGESVMMTLRLDADDCQYTELLQPPPDVRIHSRDFECCLMIRSPKMSALLVAHKARVFT